MRSAGASRNDSTDFPRLESSVADMFTVRSGRLWSCESAKNAKIQWFNEMQGALGKGEVESSILSGSTNQIKVLEARRPTRLCYISEAEIRGVGDVERGLAWPPGQGRVKNPDTSFRGRRGCQKSRPLFFALVRLLSNSPSYQHPTSGFIRRCDVDFPRVPSPARPP